MNEYRPLPRSFYAPSAKVVARALLGHWLIRHTADGRCGGPIVETEGYVDGDPACHGFPGPTARNQVMFGPPGHAYVYLIYGFHFCVNAVCCPPGLAEAVLIRAVAPEIGLDSMRSRRPVGKLSHLTSGPGKLCQALAIDRSLNGADLCDVKAPLVICENPAIRRLRRELGPVVTTTRIGITKAASLPLRFYFQKSPFVSRKAG